MFLSDATLDDLLYRVLTKLLASKNHIYPSRGPATELTGVLLQLTNPRSRLSRTERKVKIFSCLGELLWYLAATNKIDFISYYVPRYKNETDDGKTVYGAYGPRFFSMERGKDRINQIFNVIDLLRKNPCSRRAVVQLFDAADINEPHKEVPCTCTLQFVVRHSRLNMMTSMRSNDAFWGLPHDVFAFTMVQEIIARSLGLEVGKYKHFAGSLHLYKEHEGGAREYLEEGYQPKVSMPPMPVGDPWPSIRKFIKAEAKIRRHGDADIRELRLDPYWSDLVRLLKVYRYSQANDSKSIGLVRRKMSVRHYDPYIEQRKRAALKNAATLEQLSLL